MKKFIAALLAFFVVIYIATNNSGKHKATADETSASATFLSDTKVLECTSCGGSGACKYCDGDGVKSSGKTCRRCDGTGVCYSCQGSGAFEVYEIDGQEYRLCTMCYGDGICGACGGTGVLSGDFRCKACGGDGYCMGCDGNGLTEYPSELPASGSVSNGTVSVSPYTPVKTICPMCNGSGKVKCSVCHGSGENSVYKYVHGFYKNIVKPYCESCNGNGYITCGRCQGSGVD